jgi:AcrR family transcriptional regulator
MVMDAATAAIADKATRQADKAIEKARLKARRKADKVRTKAAYHAEALDRLADHLATVDVWTRAEPNRRKPRFTRDEIAAAALRIADEEGFGAVSMRRLAVELDAGTMTLYYYLRTKDELLALISDAVLGEIVLPPGQPLPSDWRQAMMLIATRSRDAIGRHPWLLDISHDPALGPNSVRHFDQSMQAVAGLDVDLRTKLDIVHAVDEYVIGYCIRERSGLHEDAAGTDVMRAYVTELIASGQYPTLSQLVQEEGLAEAWGQIHVHAEDPARFERNVSRLLDGFEAEITSRRQRS